MNYKDFLEKAQSELPEHLQYHQIIEKMYNAMLKGNFKSNHIVHNVRNTEGTGVNGIDATIKRLEAEGFFVEKVQESTHDLGDGLKQLHYVTIKVSFNEIKTIYVGSVTDPEINNPLPSFANGQPAT